MLGKSSSQLINRTELIPKNKKMIICVTLCVVIRALIDRHFLTSVVFKYENILGFIPKKSKRKRIQSEEPLEVD